MSTQEELAALGQIAVDRSRLTVRRTALEQELATMIRMIREVDAAFTGMGGMLRLDREEARTALHATIQRGGLDRINTLLKEYDQTSQELRQVEARAARVGI